MATEHRVIIVGGFSHLWGILRDFQKLGRDMQLLPAETGTVNLEAYEDKVLETLSSWRDAEERRLRKAALFGIRYGSPMLGICEVQSCLEPQVQEYPGLTPSWLKTDRHSPETPKRFFNHHHTGARAAKRAAKKRRRSKKS